jgi:hypothetical protein
VAEFVDLVEVEHGGAVFHAEAAAGEDDDVVADVGWGGWRSVRKATFGQ